VVKTFTKPPFNAKYQLQNKSSSRLQTLTRLPGLPGFFVRHGHFEGDRCPNSPHRFHHEDRDGFCCVEQPDYFENEFVFLPRRYLIHDKLVGKVGEIQSWTTE
jgi:hypothetical protein